MITKEQIFISTNKNDLYRIPLNQPNPMEKYINMNDSFGNKHSTSSTKSFQTYDDSIQTLKQQLQNHQKALQTAQNIVEQYQLQNQQLILEINSLKQAKLKVQQKYEVLQNLFIKLDKAKQKQLHKQTQRTHEKHILQIQNLNAKHQQQISSLNQTIMLLELQLHKYQIQQKKYQNLLSSYQQNILSSNKQKHTQIPLIPSQVLSQKPFIDHFSMTKRSQTQKSEDSLQKVYIKTATKFSSNPHIIQSRKPRNSIKSVKERRTTKQPQVQLIEKLSKGHIIIGRGSVDRNKDEDRDSQIKGNKFERKDMRQSQLRLNTAEDYFSQKVHTIKAHKPKHLLIYDNNFTDHKDYKQLY